MTTVTVLTTAGCSKCAKAKELLHELQQEHDFELDERTIADNPDLVNKHDLMVSPGIVIDGELVAQGVPAKDELRKILHQHSDED